MTSAKLQMLQVSLQAAPRTTYALGGWVVANALAPLGMIVFTGAAIDRIPGVIRDGFESGSGRSLLTMLILAVALLTISLLLGPLFETLSNTIKAKLVAGMRERLASAVGQPATIEHLEDPSAIDQLEAARGSLMTSFPAEAPAALAVVLSTRLTGVIACAIVATYEWWLGLGLLCFWLVGRVPVRRQAIRTAEAVVDETSSMRRAKYFQLLATQPLAAKEIRIYGLGDWIVGNYRRHFADGVARIWRTQDREILWVISLGSGMAIVYAAAYWMVAGDAAGGSLSAGWLAVLIPTISMTALAGMVTPADFTLEFAVTGYPPLLDYEAMVRASTEARETEQAAPGYSMPDGNLALRGLTFSYPGQDAPTIDGLTLELPSGTSTAIVGPNGAGKSTLVKLLARLYEPSAGRMTLGGVDISTIPTEDWRRQQLAVVFQDFTRYPLSAADNIGLASVENVSDLDGIREAAGRAGIDAYIESLPDGWNTVLSREFGGVDLSGGQWQRIALARALFAVHHGARMLVLDEPTAWLDAYGEAVFFDEFLDLTSGVTSILISHRFSTIRKADQIVVLDSGKIVERGNHESLVALGGQYASAFALQASRFADAEHSESS